MTPLDRGAKFAPSPQAVSILRERLQQMGWPISESAAQSLLDAVFALEGPRLYSQLRGSFENSLEIIRDTAESALGGVTERRAERSDLLGGGRRSVAPRRPSEMVDEEFDDDDPRPVFKRTRR
jgi:hypothetical protein